MSDNRRIKHRGDGSAEGVPQRPESSGSERICGACGEPIHEQEQWTRWGPVHRRCKDRAPDE